MARKIDVFFSVCLVGILLFLGTPSSVGASGDHQEFSLRDFQLESETTLPNAKVVYVTYGALNASRSNAILLPSWYSGDHHGYDSLIGPGKALDPAEYFIIATDQFSNGLSSSPSNTPAPYSGADFPKIAVRDNVAATHRLVTEVFGVDPSGHCRVFDVRPAGLTVGRESSRHGGRRCRLLR